MPYHVESDHPDCSGHAVVKDSDGEVMGCHKTMQEAQDQMAALYAEEPMMEMKGRSARSGFIAPLRDVEWRSSGNGQGDFTFTGRAVVYDHWSEPLWTPLGTFRERIMPGAFAKVLERKPDVRLLFNHDENFVLARTKSGTLELEERDDGLHVWARVAPTSYAQDLRIVMSRGDVDQMSFSFAMEEDLGAEDRWYEDDDSGEIRRDVHAVSDLHDVSPVTFPAYVDTTAAMRELRSAVEAGKISIPLEQVAQAEIDPADPQTDPASAEAEIDPPVGEDRDASAQAEIDPAVGGLDALTKLRTVSSETVRAEKEQYLGLLREIAHATHQADRGGP